MGKKKSRKSRNIIGIVLVILIGLVGWSMVSAMSAQSKSRDKHLGIAEYQKGNYQEAITHYNHGIKSNPDDACLFNNRGLVYFKLRKYDEAISDHTKAIELRSDFADAYYNRGLANFRNGYYGKRELLDKAISDFGKAIEIKPDFMEAYYVRGLTYTQFVFYHDKYETIPSDFPAEVKEKFADAFSDFTKVIESGSPYAVLAIAGRAGLFYKHGDWKLAEREYDRALERKEEIINLAGQEGLGGVYASRARNYFSLGELEKAFSDYEKFLDLVPDPLVAFGVEGPGTGIGNAAHVAMGLGKYEKAIEYYDKLIDTMEKHPDYSREALYVYYGKGYSYYKLGQYNKAIVNLKKFLDLGDRADARMCLGKIYKEKGDIQKARGEFQKALKLYDKRITPEGVYGYSQRGLCYLALGQYDKAISDFEKIISLKFKSDRTSDHTNRYLEAHTNIGIVYSEMGNKEKAKEYFQRTIQLAKERGYTTTIEEVEQLLIKL